MNARHRAGTVALAGALTLFALLASAAQATYDPLATGTATRLTLDKGFLSFLRANGVKLRAKAPAKLKGRILTLPVSGGEMDPTIGKGTIEQGGVLIFSSGRRSLPFKELTLKTKHSPLLAKVGGGQLKLASAKTISTRRDGFGSDFSAKDLKLSGKVAVRLDKKLHLGDAFEEGQLLGSFTSKTQPQTVTVLPTGKATVVLDAALVAKLKALFVSVNPVFPAEHAGPTFTFPIVLGGAIGPAATVGTLRTGGDIEFLQLGGGQIFQHEFWLDLGARIDSAEVNFQPSPPYPGKEGRVGAYDINTTAATVASDPGARTIALTGASLTLQAATAVAFNEAFAERKDVFKAGEVLGSLSFTAQTQ